MAEVAWAEQNATQTAQQIEAVMAHSATADVTRRHAENFWRIGDRSFRCRYKQMRSTFNPPFLPSLACNTKFASIVRLAHHITFSADKALIQQARRRRLPRMSREISCSDSGSNSTWRNRPQQIGLWPLWNALTAFNLAAYAAVKR